jgi:hypothetical protein
MRTKRPLFALAALVVASSVVLAAGVKSGPQTGARVPGPFHPLNINGDKAGQKNCLFCSNGDRPVAMIFAREVTPALTKLIKEIDVATKASGDKKGSFVVFLGDKTSLEGKLKSVVEKQKLTDCVLSIDNPAGPEGYEVSKDADVTIVLYKERKVKNNWAFKKGELTEKTIPTVVKAFKSME